MLDLYVISALCQMIIQLYFRSNALRLGRSKQAVSDLISSIDPRSSLNLAANHQLHAAAMATDEDIDVLSTLGGYLVFSILHRRPLPKILTLIDAGAPLWYQDDEGTSALHAAAYIEDEELVRLLIAKGAVWNAGRPK